MNTWYYAIDGQTHGPFDEAAMAGLIGKGTIGATTWVMGEGRTDWIGADQSPLVKYLPSSVILQDAHDPLPPTATSRDETLHSAGKSPRRWRRLAIIIGGVLVTIWLIAALIATVVDRHEHRRGNPARAIYPIIGESVEDLLVRFHETNGDIKPDENGLSRVLLFEAGANECTDVYFLDKRVVAFRITPLPRSMDARACSRYI